MKIIKLIPVILVMFISSIAFAGGGKSCDEKIRNKDIFTPEQIEMKIRHCETLKPKMKAFKETLTPAQKEIKKDATLTRKQRHEKINSILTPEQNAMRAEIKAIRKAQKEEFRATLTPEQKSY